MMGTYGCFDPKAMRAWQRRQEALDRAGRPKVRYFNVPHPYHEDEVAQWQWDAANMERVLAELEAEDAANEAQEGTLQPRGGETAENDEGASTGRKSGK